MKEPIMQYFSYAHLPPALQAISKPFCDLAHLIADGTAELEVGPGWPSNGPGWPSNGLPRNPERSVALRKLLEAKDAAVRAFLTPTPEAT